MYSPQYPQHTHVSEIYAEDKSILFSMDHVVHGTVNAKKNYNIGLHEYARIFIERNIHLSFPHLPEDIWQKLELISDFSEEYIRKHIGRPDVEALPVSIVLFFVFPIQFQKNLPKIYDGLTKILNLSPVNAIDPIVDRSIMGRDVS